MNSPKSLGYTRRALLAGGTVLFAATAAKANPLQLGGHPHSANTGVSAVWVNDGGDKVTRDELRHNAIPASTLNSVWDGTKITVFGAKNEVVNFNIVLEAASFSATNVSVTLDNLIGPGGFKISGDRAVDNAGLFSWVNRDIELFLVRYLQINGLSLMGYDDYYEPHIPAKLRRPPGRVWGYTGGWTNRPNHDKFYPDIAVPIELTPTFSIAVGQNQSVWVDIYIPKMAMAGLYTGNVQVSEGATLDYTIPVELTVRNFALSDVPNSKTMLVISRDNISKRYSGITYPNPNSAESALIKAVVDKHYLLGRRHKITLVDNNDDAELWTLDQPRPEWIPRLNGTLFTSARGYKGPGENTPHDLFVIGPYGGWRDEWGDAPTNQETFYSHVDAWEQWFKSNYPKIDRFLYLIDESRDFAQIQGWANWIRTNPSVGQSLRSFATIDLLDALSSVPALDIAASWKSVADTIPWNSAFASWKSDPRRLFFMYNGIHPASGSFVIEADGTDLREIPWGQYKKGIDRWFYWDSTYYDNYQASRGDTNVFTTAMTFGANTAFDAASRGRTGWNYSNGEGVLFYPGTDRVFPAQSYGIQGPIASLRLKHWRRGIQDVDYLTIAAAINSSAVQTIVNSIVPKVLWEYGVDDPADPTWVKQQLSWSPDPDIWEAARKRLADIIDPP